jgi:hypothetical protein
MFITKAGNNFLKVPIYCKNAFGFGRGNINKLDEEFFAVGNDMEKRKTLIGLTWEKLSNNGTINTADEITRDLGIMFTQEQYNGLSNAYRSAENRYRKIDAEMVTLDAFLGRFMKGSKPFRNVLVSVGVKTKPALIPQVKTFL